MKEEKTFIEKAKDFICNHKKEFIISAGIIFSYRLGFKRGYRLSMDTFDHLINKSCELINF